MVARYCLVFAYAVTESVPIIPCAKESADTTFERLGFSFNALDQFALKLLLSEEVVPVLL